MTDFSTNRRRALQALSILGASAPIAVSLANPDAAHAGAFSDYRALICLYMQGGNNSTNMLLPTDPGSWKLYWDARSKGSDPIALMPLNTPPVPVGQMSAVTKRSVQNLTYPESWGGVLPIVPKTVQRVPLGAANSVRTFAVHPLMPRVQALFKAGRLAFLANVGTKVFPITAAVYKAGPVNAQQLPAQLASHDDQTRQWTVEPKSGLGFGGLIEDQLVDWSVDNSRRFATFSVAGGQSFLTGGTIRPYSLGANSTGAVAPTISIKTLTGTTGQSVVNSAVKFAPGTSFSALMTGVLSANNLSRDAGDVYNPIADAYHAQMDYAQIDPPKFNDALKLSSASVPKPEAYTNPTSGTVQTNELANQFYAVAQTLAARGALGVQRQVFYVSLGSFDTHDGQNQRQGTLLSKVDHALDYFNTALETLNLGNSVTVYTASEFGRTFDSNGDGTDHGWGGHHMIMGGAVKGGDIFGTYPDFTADRSGRWIIPNLAVDQYISTLAQWMGVPEATVLQILPNLGNFKTAGGTKLGFMKA